MSKRRSDSTTQSAKRQKLGPLLAEFFIKNSATLLEKLETIDHVDPVDKKVDEKQDLVDKKVDSYMVRPPLDSFMSETPHERVLRILKKFDSSFSGIVTLGDNPRITVTVKQGLIHSSYGMPAVVVQYTGGTIDMWFNEGKLDRENDKPAVMYSDGIMVWYKNDLPDRNILPAFISSKYTVTYLKGKMHSYDDQPSMRVVGDDEFKIIKSTWHTDGQIDRIGNPAIIAMGGKIRVWKRKGVLHRDGGRPAYIDEIKNIYVVYENGVAISRSRGKREVGFATTNLTE